MADRFEFENLLMKCWNVVDDIDLVTTIVSDIDMTAEDKDRLLNILIGLRELYNARFNNTFNMFEQLLKEKFFPEIQLDDIQLKFYDL